MQFRGTTSTFILAGWLLADLFLGLTMMFFLANTIGVPQPELPEITDMPTQTPLPTYTLQPTHTLQPTYTLQPTNPPPPTPEIIVVRVGLNPEPIVDVEAVTLGQLVQVIQTNVGSREIGLVLIYGYSPDRARGVSRARTAYSSLDRQLDSITQRTIFYPLHWQYPTETYYKATVFVYNEDPTDG